MKTIIATTFKCEQVSMDDFENFYFSMECEEHTTILDILKWAQEVTKSKELPHINTIKFSQKL